VNFLLVGTNENGLKRRGMWARGAVKGGHENMGRQGAGAPPGRTNLLAGCSGRQCTLKKEAGFAAAWGAKEGQAMRR
jgi:hypothetical protein